MKMKITYSIVKWYPVLMNAMFVYIYACSLIGIDVNNYFLCILFGQSLVTVSLVYVLGCYLKFCLWHRFLLYSMFYNMFVELIQFFNENIPYELYISTVITASLIIMATLTTRKNGFKFKKNIIESAKKTC